MDQRLPDPAGAAPPDLRGLCEELLDAYVWCIDEYMHDPASEDTLVQRARAALAQPEAEVVGPTRDELWELWLRLDRELPDRPAAVAEFWEHAQIEARTRWGRPAPAPAGEVADPMIPSRYTGHLKDVYRDGYHSGYKNGLTRAADLLERQAAPVPVAVAERLPGAEDCDAEGRVWLYRPQTPILNPYWDLVKLDYIDIDPVSPTHWLPAHALPLPSEKVE